MRIPSDGAQRGGVVQDERGPELVQDRLPDAAAARVKRHAARVLGALIAKIGLSRAVRKVSRGRVVDGALHDLAEPGDEPVQHGDDEEDAHPFPMYPDVSW